MLTNLAEDALVVQLAGAEGIVLKPLRAGGAFEAHAHDEHDEDDHDEDDAASEDDGHEHGHNHDHGAVDFHLWLDPENAVLMVYAIVDALSAADPANAATYEANAATYEANANALIDRLDGLIAELDLELAAVRDRPFIVLHDAYRYFEDRFRLTVAGSITVNPEQAPGVQRITEIRDRVRALGGVCVFAEPQFDTRVIDVVTEGTAARSGTIDPLGAAIEDGLELYFTLLRNLAASFTECLAATG